MKLKTEWLLTGIVILVAGMLAYTFITNKFGDKLGLGSTYEEDGE